MLCLCCSKGNTLCTLTITEVISPFITVDDILSHSRARGGREVSEFSVIFTYNDCGGS
jgi:hypothetical protein